MEKPKGWTKEDINRARDRALEEQRRAAAGPAMTDAADAGDELEPIPAGESAHVLARTRMAELALALQGLPWQWQRRACTDRVSSSDLMDIAGNAFCGVVCSPVLF